MLQICVELRALSGGRSLITCADGADLILSVDACEVQKALRKSVDAESLDPLGERLKEALMQHSSICYVDQAGPHAIDNGNANAKYPLSAPTVFICGNIHLGKALGNTLTDVATLVSDKNIKDFSYEMPDKGLLLACRSDESMDVFNHSLNHLRHSRVTWCAVDRTASSLLIGPLVHRGIGADYGDCLTRSRGNSINLEVHIAKSQPAVWGDFLTRLTASRELLLVSARVIKTLVETVAGSAEQNPCRDVVWEIDLHGNVAEHPVLPCYFGITPLKDYAAPSPCVHTATFIIDNKFGIVNKLDIARHSEYTPSTLHTAAAQVTDLRKISGYTNSIFCQGSALIPRNTKSRARKKLIEDIKQAALGESVERYCSNFIYLKPVMYGSYSQLARRGYPLIPPEEFVLFSERQYAKTGFPFVRFTRDLPVFWIEGQYYDTNESVFVPASLVYTDWRIKPAINFPALSGIAAGQSFDQAVLAGLSEIIERHATMVWWLNAHPLPFLKLTKSQRMLFTGTKEPLRPGLIHLDNTFDVPVVAGVVHNDMSQFVHIGFACRANVADAALKAWTEALTLQEDARDFNNPDGANWKAINNGLVPGQSYKKWRADRRYLDDFQPNLVDVETLSAQHQLFLDPRAVKRVSHLLDLPETRNPASAPEVQNPILEGCIKKVHARGMRIITVDITSPDVALCGWRVVRTIVPGTVGNTPSAFPYLGKGVVFAEAVRLGWFEVPLEEDQVNIFPMPHA